MNLWPPFGLVTQRSLKSVRLELEDRPVERASLFPLFDVDGRTRVVMVTAEESSRIMLADWTPSLFARDWRRRNRLRVRFADLSDASTWDESRFVDLWHFDPWWVLGDERYHGHGSVPGLRRTNIPGYDISISGLTFSGDLGRASYLTKGSGDSMRVRRFRPDTLAAVALNRRRSHDRPRAAAVVGWRLRPFWQFR